MPKGEETLVIVFEDKRFCLGISVLNSTDHLLYWKQAAIAFSSVYSCFLREWMPAIAFSHWNAINKQLHCKEDTNFKHLS